VDGLGQLEDSPGWFPVLVVVARRMSRTRPWSSGMTPLTLTEGRGQLIIHRGILGAAEPPESRTKRLAGAGYGRSRLSESNR